MIKYVKVWCSGVVVMVTAQFLSLNFETDFAYFQIQIPTRPRFAMVRTSDNVSSRK